MYSVIQVTCNIITLPIVWRSSYDSVRPGLCGSDKNMNKGLLPISSSRLLLRARSRRIVAQAEGVGNGIVKKRKAVPMQPPYNVLITGSTKGEWTPACLLHADQTCMRHASLSPLSYQGWGGH